MSCRAIFALTAAILFACIAGQTPRCKSTAWEKIRGMRPDFFRSLKLLHTGVDSHGLTSTCFEKCKNISCEAFIIDLEGSSCMALLPDGDELVNEPNVTFFHEICLEVPPNCLKTRLWHVERYLGSELLDSSAQLQSDVISRTECYERCFEKGKKCKSAQFRASEPVKIEDSFGSCTLLTIDRGTKPQAYRTSMYRDEYLENQCHDLARTDYCSYAEYRNVSMPYSDFAVTGLSPKQCEKRCDASSDGFICRAYTIEFAAESTNLPTCYLHSEDTIGAGVSVLAHTARAFYKEREPCIDVTVECTNSSLTVELKTAEPFAGRMYASGYSDTCGVTGQSEKLTRLVLPMPDTRDTENNEASCGLLPVMSMNQENRTSSVIWSTVIIQFNPIIQRLGDQAIRVGCSLDRAALPTPRNITVNSGFTFVNSNAGLPSIVSTIRNKSSDAPLVTMSILDLSHNRANVTHLGQKLLLKIQIKPNDGPFDIMAGHLIASTNTGDSSLLLLDELGCPVTNVFPALTRDPSNNRTLLAEFSAFKFPNSQHVKFNGVVKFCIDSCEPALCKGNVSSFGRKKRSIEEQSANVTQIAKEKSTSVDKLALEASVIVKGSENEEVYPNPLRSKDDTILLHDKFCMDPSLALFLLIFLLIIQIILLAACLLSVRAYRSMAIRAEEDRADILARHLYGVHGGNFEIGRRVRWADNPSSTLS
ncbi:hypothetical protein TKK_0006146 [Trichogramma kaykai]|uniref:ZP domain-containing protein n=1 Tax=Trichogramma kaykai TaxID=54128 RepID=A0ABD2XE10_9HYME